MFEIIETPFMPLKTVKTVGSDSFRPCSTGVDIEDLKKRTMMEGLEVDSLECSGVIASAANNDRESSVANTINEAVERISLASWWALNRPFTSRLSNKYIKNIFLEDGIEENDNFSVNVGFVESIDSGLYVACSILENERSYPFIVLGGGCSKSISVAARKAIYESIQSWTATEWLRRNCSADDQVYWDTGELKRRLGELIKTPVRPLINDEPRQDSCSLKGVDLFTESIDDVYISRAVLSDGSFSHSTQQLARMAMRSNEQVSVFTQHNI